jgi:ATPase subunit of ABC transporter with duplicated ATPase domains
MFLMLRLNRPNFLVMDEPTNHIDIDGREELEAQLAESGATLLMTSHDRRFIDNVASRFVQVTNGTLQEITEPEVFYAAAAEHGADEVAEGHGARTSQSRDARDEPTAGDEEAILERIVELEALLAADRARKEKFQKPRRQAAWVKELERLNSRLSG